MKKLLSGCVLLVAVVLAIPAIVFLSLRDTLTNPSVYTAEFEEAGVYDALVNEFLASDALSGEGVAVYVEFAQDNIDLKSVVKDTLDSNLASILNWLGGRSDKLNIYLPVSTLRESFSNEEIKGLMMAGFEESYFKGKRDCSPQEAKQFNKLKEIKSLEDFVDTDEFNLPDCVPPNKEDILRLVRTEIEKQINQELQGSSFVDLALESAGIEGIDGDFIPAEQVFTELESREAYDNLQQVRTVMEQLSIGAWVALGISAGIILLVALFVPSTMIGKFAAVGWPLLLIGGSVAFVGAVPVVAGADIAAEIQTQIVAEGIATSLDSINPAMLASNLINAIFRPLMYWGAAILLVGILSLVMRFVLPRQSKHS